MNARRVLLTPIAFGVWLSASAAAGAEPTKQECVAANESAQDLQRTGKLREARASLAVCIAASCPGAVREDCGQRLKEVEATLPRLVFAAKDAQGHDLSAVRVMMDGEVLLEKLNGEATTVDPGEHHFTFEADGFRPSETTLLVRVGEMDRPVRIVLVSTAAPTGTEQGSGGWFDANTRRSLGITLGAAGVAGVAVGAVFGILAKSTMDTAKSDCGGQVSRCTGPLNGTPLQMQQARQKGHDDYNSALGLATVSTVGFIGGGALVLVGAVLFFTAPAAAAAPTVGEVAIAPTVSREGGGFVLRGRW